MVAGRCGSLLFQIPFRARDGLGRHDGRSCGLDPILNAWMENGEKQRSRVGRGAGDIKKLKFDGGAAQRKDKSQAPPRFHSSRLLNKLSFTEAEIISITARKTLISPHEVLARSKEEGQAQGITRECIFAAGLGVGSSLRPALLRATSPSTSAHWWAHG